jgi:hypothetical protein
LNAFDFSQNPRPPHIIPLSQAQIDAVKRYFLLLLQLAREDQLGRIQESFT